MKTGNDTEPGINGSFFKREEGWSTVSNVISVKDIDGAISRIEKLGGSIAFPKTVINGVGYLAYFRDPEGNVFGMMENDPEVNSKDGM